jgi:hypothetical protein
MTVDSAAAAIVVTTRGRASVGLAFMAVPYGPVSVGKSPVLLGPTFLQASCFSPFSRA